MKGLADNRSPLAKAIGERVPAKTVTLDRGRLAGVPMALRSLSAGALQQASRDALKYLTETGWRDEHLFTELGKSALNTETAVRILAAALVVPPAADTGKVSDLEMFTSGPDQVRALLEPDEITLLFNEFCGWQEERSPISRAKSWEEVEDFVEALGKGAVPTSRLLSFDTSSLCFMLREVAARWTTATRRPSSGTSPFGEPGPTSSTPSASAQSTAPVMEVL